MWRVVEACLAVRSVARARSARSAVFWVISDSPRERKELAWLVIRVLREREKCWEGAEWRWERDIPRVVENLEGEEGFVVLFRWWWLLWLLVVLVLLWWCGVRSVVGEEERGRRWWPPRDWERDLTFQPVMEDTVSPLLLGISLGRP